MTPQELRNALVGRTIIDYGLTQDGFVFRLDKDIDLELGYDGDDWWVKIYRDFPQ